MQNAICKGRVLPDGLGLNQCFIDWKTPYPDPGSAIRCASRVGLGIFYFLWTIVVVATVDLIWDVGGSKRNCEGKQCCCCPQFPRPSPGGGGPPPTKRQNAFSDSCPFRKKGKEPNMKSSPPPAHSQFHQCTPLLTSQTNLMTIGAVDAICWECISVLALFNWSDVTY
jgi:hypothetical protein